MASSSSCAAESDDAELIALYETFSSVCSLQDIALAYIKAGHNVERAGNILCNVNKKHTEASFHDFTGETSFKPLDESSAMGNTGSSALLGRASNGRKPKKLSASVGTVSSILGKTYFRPIESLNEPPRTTKPLKLKVLDTSITESGTVRLCLDPAADQNLLNNIKKQTSISNKDVEEFLFSMLGDGFKLSMDNIRDVLGDCGYNVKQSMDELLSLTAETLDINKAVDHNLHKIKRLKEETSYGIECKRLPQGCSQEIPFRNEEKTNLSREVLKSLFSIPDRFEEEPKVKRLEWGLNRTRVTGQKLVTESYEDFTLSPTPDIELALVDSNKDDEDDYQLLRTATKQHWDIMKLYYDAAVDAFTNGDRAQANYCLEQGKLSYQMAREADEKSSGMILEKGEFDKKGNELPLDLHSHPANESIRLLKLHLFSLANIPSFRYLRVTINTENDNTSRGKRRREKVTDRTEFTLRSSGRVERHEEGEIDAGGGRADESSGTSRDGRSDRLDCALVCVLPSATGYQTDHQKQTRSQNRALSMNDEMP